VWQVKGLSSCKGVHVNRTQCWSNVSTVPVVDKE
jgi:hypothetical protein